MAISKITPVVIVKAIEGELSFWQEQMGYEVLHTVLHGGHIGFAILKNGDSEIMLQSVDSAGDDLKLGDKLNPGTVLLYADVKSLDEAIKANKDGKVLIEKRTTSYGATETWLRTPSGTILGLAAFSKQD